MLTRAKESVGQVLEMETSSCLLWINAPAFACLPSVCPGLREPHALDAP